MGVCFCDVGSTEDGWLSMIFTGVFLKTYVLELELPPGALLEVCADTADTCLWSWLCESIICS